LFGKNLPYGEELLAKNQHHYIEDIFSIEADVVNQKAHQTLYIGIILLISLVSTERNRKAQHPQRHANANASSKIILVIVP